MAKSLAKTKTIFSLKSYKIFILSAVFYIVFQALSSLAILTLAYPNGSGFRLSELTAYALITAFMPIVYSLIAYFTQKANSVKYERYTVALLYGFFMASIVGLVSNPLIMYLSQFFPITNGQLGLSIIAPVAGVVLLLAAAVFNRVKNVSTQTIFLKLLIGLHILAFVVLAYTLVLTSPSGDRLGFVDYLNNYLIDIIPLAIPFILLVVTYFLLGYIKQRRVRILKTLFYVYTVGIIIYTLGYFIPALTPYISALGDADTSIITAAPVTTTIAVLALYAFLLVRNRRTKTL